MDTQDEMLTIACWSNNNANIHSKRKDEFQIEREVWEAMSTEERVEEIREYLAQNGHFDFDFTDPIENA
ncbi:hypothetical protein [Deinococcus sp. Leaf326]|uniref:DUF7167 family protein n=1 Tax=Deinococcus sp. Leaf326 TaxID=1736338 RepID=UPI0012E2BAD2|nr:hypothetical protein [Deinococcus sp. Leaf326]